MALKEPGDPTIVYNPEYTSLSYRGKNLSFHQLQSGLNELIEDTWAQLLTLTGNKKIPVKVPPLMSEDIRSAGMGYSFINSVTTEPPTLPLLFEMGQSSGLRLLRPDGPGSRKFEADPSASQEFFHVLKPIVEAISFLIHATGSGPLRLSEVVDDRYSNGSGPRNLYISHGLVFLVRRNLKSSTLRGYRSSVVHFPPQKVVDLLVYYLVVIRPVEILLTASLGWKDEHANYSQFLHVVKGRKSSPQELSMVVSNLTNKYFKCRLTGSQLRHVLINIQRVFIRPIVDPSIQSFGDSQAGHGSSVANRVYGQRIDHLPGEEASMFVLAHDWCKKLHTVLGLGPETSLIRPVPYIHAPPEPTWWRPSDYLPPQPPSTQEIMAQVHHGIATGLSFAVEQLSARYEKMVKESVFQAVAALSAKGVPNWPAVTQPPPPVLDQNYLPLAHHGVSF